MLVFQPDFLPSGYQSLDQPFCFLYTPLLIEDLSTMAFTTLLFLAIMTPPVMTVYLYQPDYFLYF